MVIQASINSFGTATVASWTAYGKVDFVYWMTVNAMGLSVTTFAGQNFGAKKYDRMKKGTLIGLGILAGMSGLVFSFWLEARLSILPGLFPPLLLPTALTTLFCGLILVVGRTTALSQVIGYLVAENGIFLLGAPLMTAGAVWFELALLLDIFVAVFVMGIAINHIGETFESIDVGRFRSLRD